MSLKRCCCVFAMRNVRHREIDDMEVRMRSRRRARLLLAFLLSRHVPCNRLSRSPCYGVPLRT